MKKLAFLGRWGSVGTVSKVGSLLAPVVDNRFVPSPHIMMFAVTRRCNSR